MWAYREIVPSFTSGAVTKTQSGFFPAFDGPTMLETRGDEVGIAAIPCVARLRFNIQPQCFACNEINDDLICTFS